MDCPKCKTETTMMVNMTVKAPSSMEGKFSKKNIVKKEFKLMGVSWDMASYHCKCGWAYRPNFVKKKTKIKELELQIDSVLKLVERHEPHEDGSKKIVYTLQQYCKIVKELTNPKKKT